ncbi:MAG TPA: hypothetical protein VFT49_04205 [Candidatus Saccharimonadales bacterium]|nr:hypothetical protein [Candidatus Saccharimonadales bacterium]
MSYSHELLTAVYLTLLVGAVCNTCYVVEKVRDTLLSHWSTGLQKAARLLGQLSFWFVLSPTCVAAGLMAGKEISPNQFPNTTFWNSYPTWHSLRAMLGGSLLLATLAMCIALILREYVNSPRYNALMAERRRKRQQRERFSSRVELPADFIPGYPA